MAAGIPQIVLDNGPERYIIVNNKTGIIALDEADFSKAIVKLYNNEEFRLSMSEYSRKYALKNYSMNKLLAVG